VISAPKESRDQLDLVDQPDNRDKLETMEHQEPKERQAVPVIPALPAHPARLEREGRLESRGLAVQRDQAELSGPMDREVTPESEAIRAPMGRLGPRAHQGPQDFKERLDLRDPTDNRELRVRWGPRDRWEKWARSEILGLGVNLEQQALPGRPESEVTLDRKVSRVPLETPDPRVHVVTMDLRESLDHLDLLETPERLEAWVQPATSEKLDPLDLPVPLGKLVVPDSVGRTASAEPRAAGARSDLQAEPDRQARQGMLASLDRLGSPGQTGLQGRLVPPDSRDNLAKGGCRALLDLMDKMDSRVLLDPQGPRGLKVRGESWV